MALISERLKALRHEKKATQKQVADYLAIQNVTYQRFEYGDRRPSLDNLIKLADYYDVSLDYITGRSDNPTRL